MATRSLCDIKLEISLNNNNKIATVLQYILILILIYSIQMKIIFPVQNDFEMHK